MLGKDQIVKAQDRPLQAVDVPEWGGQVNVRALSVRDMERLYTGKRGDAEASAVVAMLAICDDQGARVFDDADLALLMDRHAGAVQRIAGVALGLSGLGVKAVEDTRGN
jgi:hypothetical protein